MKVLWVVFYSRNLNRKLVRETEREQTKYAILIQYTSATVPLYKPGNCMFDYRLQVQLYKEINNSAGKGEKYYLAKNPRESPYLTKM